MQLKNLAAIAVAVWLLFFGGCSAIQRATTQFNPSGVVSIIQNGAQTTIAAPVPQVILPTPRTAPIQRPPIVVSEPSRAPIVVPQTQFQVTATTVPPTPVVTPFPAEYQATATPVFNGPAIGTADCNSQNATYKAEKDVIFGMPPNGVPLGHVAAWSCQSEAAVVQSVQEQESAMVAKYTAAHK